MLTYSPPSPSDENLNKKFPSINNFISFIEKNLKPLGQISLLVFLTLSLLVVGSLVSNPKRIYKSKAGNITPTPISLKEPQPNKELESLTLEIVRSSASYERQKDPSLLENIRDSTERRKKLLKALAKENPKEVFKFVYPSDITGDLPGEVRGEVGQITTIEGELEVFHADDFERNISILEFFIKTKSGERLTLHLTKKDEFSLTGTKVKVSGIRLDNEMVVDNEIKENFQILPTKVKGITTPIVKKIAVFLINFQNYPTQPYTVGQARGIVFTNPDSVKAYYNESSFGSWRFEGVQNPTQGDVFGWFTVPYNNVNCGYMYTAWTDVANQMAAAQGVNIEAYDKRVYAFNDSPDCPGSGWAYLGGRNAWTTIMNRKVVGHELGHTFGNLHASSKRCFDSSGNQVPISGNCQDYEYGDLHDIMGGQAQDIITLHFNNFYKGLLGFYEPSNTQVASVSGTYTIAPQEPNTSSVQSLRVPYLFSPNGQPDRYYYLEFRRPFGVFDNYSPTDPWVNGIGVRIAYTQYQSYGNTFLLDMVMGNGSVFDPLPPGQTWNDPARGLSVNVQSVSPVAATVQLTRVCAHNGPSVVIYPVNRWAHPGEPRTYDVTVTNTDSDICPPSTFSIVPTLPAGWSQNPPTFTETLAPYTSVTRTFEITSDPNTPDGIYTFTQTATNTGAPSYSGSNYAYFGIYRVDNTPPSVQIMWPYNGDTVAETVQVRAQAFDTIGVTRVEFFVDDALVDTQYSNFGMYIFNWNTRTYANGPHTIQAKAYDAAGNVGLSNIVNVTVNNSYTFTLNPGGLNDIAIPVNVSGVVDAESLATYIETQGGTPHGSVQQLQKWDASSQIFLSWSHEFGFGDNFPIATGDYIFLVLTDAAPTSVSFTGNPPAPGSVRFTLTRGQSADECATNYISLPLDHPEITNADQLSDSIGGVTQALDWDSSQQIFLAWSNQNGFGDNFQTQVGYPYSVCLDNTAPSTWP